MVAIYSTFLNRAFDQLLMDVALLKQPVTLVLDRAGVTGPDGPSHHGMWDLSLMAIVPGMRVAAPRDAVRLREELGEALDTDTGPTALRYSKGAVPEDIRAVERLDDGVDVLHRSPGSDPSDVLIVGVGAFCALAVDTAERLAKQGIRATVVDPRWVLPVPDSVVELARGHRLVSHSRTPASRVASVRGRGASARREHRRRHPAAGHPAGVPRATLLAGSCLPNWASPHRISRAGSRRRSRRCSRRRR